MTTPRVPTLAIDKELRDKLLFTLLALVIYRIGAHIAAPGVNVTALADFIRNSAAAGFFGLYDALGGGLQHDGRDRARLRALLGVELGRAHGIDGAGAYLVTAALGHGDGIAKRGGALDREHGRGRLGASRSRRVEKEDSAGERDYGSPRRRPQRVSGRRRSRPSHDASS